jgi:hydroxymethylpyrimidine/phosphomethylpyrimidine kinase
MQGNSCNDCMDKASQPICLTIAGLDPSGGAGIAADIKTFRAFGCFPTAVVSSITFQNTTAVFGAEHQTSECVRSQLLPVLEDYAISAVKTGMLPSREVIEEVGNILYSSGIETIVVDPVVRSTSGFDLIDDAALRSMIDVLFPIATLITPNIPEAERIAGFKINSTADIRRAAEAMHALGAKNVLIKGGHFAADCDLGKAVDHLFELGSVTAFEGEFIATTATHGTGCSLAAAITANLAKHRTLPDSITLAKDFVTNAIRTAPMIGKGHSPINI